MQFVKIFVCPGNNTKGLYMIVFPFLKAAFPAYGMVFPALKIKFPHQIRIFPVYIITFPGRGKVFIIQLCGLLMLDRQNAPAA